MWGFWKYFVTRLRFISDNSQNSQPSSAEAQFARIPNKNVLHIYSVCKSVLLNLSEDVLEKEIFLFSTCTSLCECADLFLLTSATDLQIGTLTVVGKFAQDWEPKNSPALLNCFDFRLSFLTLSNIANIWVNDYSCLFMKKYRLTGDQCQVHVRSPNFRKHADCLPLPKFK